MSLLLLHRSSPPYLREIISKTPRGCPKPWVVPNPVDTVYIPTHILFKGRAFRLLFGVSQFPASLPLCR